MARILLVDDEQDLIDTVGVLLKAEGHELIPVTEGIEALEHIQGLGEIDLLICDLRMAPVDGLEVIEVARKERPKMDVVVLSAYLDDAMIKKVADLGVTAYVKKPFTVDDIMNPILEIIERRRKATETGGEE